MVAPILTPVSRVSANRWPPEAEFDDVLPHPDGFLVTIKTPSLSLLNAQEGLRFESVITQLKYCEFFKQEIGT
jgi:hypothetical protein